MPQAEQNKCLQGTRYSRARDPDVEPAGMNSRKKAQESQKEERTALEFVESAQHAKSGQRANSVAKTKTDSSATKDAVEENTDMRSAIARYQENAE